MNTKKLWLGFIAVMVISFGVLLYYGGEIYRQAPPIPDKVVTEDGTVLFTGQDIKDGQNVWQSLGGQEVGSIWGHGAYQAPDWSADWLHREASFMVNELAKESEGQAFDQLPKDKQAGLEAKLQGLIRKNTYDPSSKTLTVSALRAKAIESNSKHYGGLFTDDATLQNLREAYAVPTNALKDPERVRLLNSFFFWASWTCVTERPGETITYTNNWPADDLVANSPTSSMHLWTGFSIILLVAGIGLMTL
ncbi:MAG: hypothetical protein ACK5IQ_07230 [Bacteroidales bacterium]